MTVLQNGKKKGISGSYLHGVHLGVFLTAALLMAPLENCCAAETEVAGPDEKRLGGYYVCFEEENGRQSMKLCKGLLTISDGMISRIDEYTEDEQGVINLDPSCVMLPGLLDIHTHIDYNGMQLWESDETDVMWDNRFEWRASAQYREDIKVKAAALLEKWSEPVFDGEEDVTKGDLLEYFSEMQAATGGTILFQGVNDTQAAYDCADSHAKIGVIRSTAQGQDLGRKEEDAALSMIQLYVPGESLTWEDPATYLPPLDTSGWEVVNAVDFETEKEWLDILLEKIENGARSGFLIHMAEGRAGNFMDTADAYSRAEFEHFMSEIEAAVEAERFSAQDVRNAHIGLIHACAVDPGSERDHAFLEKYGIGLIWSPVSNLMLYGDTPDFYRYLDDPELMIALGSDWSPSGSKTIWDECRFSYDLMCALEEEKESTREDLLKACTVDPAQMLGEGRLGNITEGGFADIFILRTDKDINGSRDAVLDAFFAEDDRAVEAVISAGTAVYGEKAFLEAYAGEAFAESYGWPDAAADDGSVGSLVNDTGDDDDPAGKSKCFYLPQQLRQKSFPELYRSYEDLMAEEEVQISKLRGTQDPIYTISVEETFDEAVEEGNQ